MLGVETAGRSQPAGLAASYRDAYLISAAMAHQQPSPINFSRSRSTPSGGVAPTRPENVATASPVAAAFNLSSSLSTGSPRSARSSFSEDGAPFSESPPSPHVRRIIVSEGNFVVEEIRDSDFADITAEHGDEILRPHQYEDAISDCESRIEKQVCDPRLVDDMERLDFDDEDDRDAWVQRMRDKKKVRRRTSSIVQKRKISESIGSSDEEDLQPAQLSAHEAGSSARRLRRKVGERASLIFDDPPPDIPELEEPESCEEVIEDDEGEGQGVDRHLPFYVQIMDVDSEEDERR